MTWPVAAHDMRPMTWLVVCSDFRIRIYILRRARLGLWAAALSAPPPETPPYEAPPRNHLPSLHPIQVFEFFGLGSKNQMCMVPHAELGTVLQVVEPSVAHQRRETLGSQGSEEL